MTMFRCLQSVLLATAALSGGLSSLTAQTAPTVSSGTAIGVPNHYVYNITLTGSNFSNPTLYVNNVATTVQHSTSTSLTAQYLAAANVKNVAVYVQQSSTLSNTVNLTLMKPHITGLVAMFHTNLDNQLCDFGTTPGSRSPCVNNKGAIPWVAMDIDIPWSALQPNGPTDQIAPPSTGNAIETALGAINAFNQAHSTNITAKIRITSGQNAPSWTTNGQLGVAFAGVSMTNSQNQQVTYPRFWDTSTTGYHQAWVNMLNQVATLYDNDPRVQEIGVTSCSTRTNEPFVWSYDDVNPQGISNTAQAAGFTDDQYKACLTNGISDYSTNFTQTPIDYTFNQFSCATGDTACTGNAISPLDFSLNLMKSFQTKLGNQAVVANHDLQDQLSPPIPASVSKIYFGDTSGNDTGALGFGLAAVGSPVELQTLNPAIPDVDKNGNSQSPGYGYEMTVDYAICQAPVSELELFPSTRVNFPDGAGTANYSVAQLNQWAAWLAAGVPASAQSECAQKLY